MKEAITISKEDYLKAILEAESEGQTVISSTLAHWLSVSPPAVTMALKRLKRDGYVEVKLDAIAANRDHIWGIQGSLRSQEKAEAEPKPGRVAKKASTASARLEKELGQDAPREALPKFVSPQLALQVDEPPEGPEWLHELKLDGYRIQARIEQGKRGNPRSVALITRGGLDWTHRMPDLAQTLAALPVKSALLDGEVVVFDEKGGTNFALLQAAFQEGTKQPLTYVVFDLLHWNGRNLRGLPLTRRKEILQTLLAGLEDEDIVRFSEHLTTDGKAIFRNACKLGAEGIVSKRASAPYRSERSAAWLKIKCVHKQEFVIGGFTLPSKTGVGIGALLLGYYRDGKLIYAGRTGTGFTQAMRKEMRAMLDTIERRQPVFAWLPPGAAHQAQWVEPKFVCEVNFATWTADNLVRQASFQGLREDKPAKDVRREAPIDLEKAKEDAARPSARRSADAGKKAPLSAMRAKNARSGKKASSPGNGFPIALTHPDRQVDSETKLTKRELADYFWSIREHLLPYIVDRPFSIVRCPRGSMQPCFFQKHVTSSLPKGIESIDIRGRQSGRMESYITLSTPLGLAGLAQMGVLEIHPWGSTNRDIEKPDLLIFDLDPDGEIDWKTLADSAREVRARLKRCKLTGFLKTTGGKGLHVVAPIEPKQDWPAVKEFARAFALRMAAENPRLYVTKMTKADRKGKIFIDYLRNDRGATSIAPYSPRARQGAPVAVPLDWKELDGAKSPRFLVAEFEKWKDRLRRDPWKKLRESRVPLDTSTVERL